MNIGDYEKALFIIDMNNGFVNFGAMANQKYNELIPEQIKMIDKFSKENGKINFVLEGHNENSTEFNTYPKHCVYGTGEAELVPELLQKSKEVESETFYKNCINGMLNRKLQDQIKEMTKLKEVVIEGVCTDLCVMDFARTLARFLDEIDRDVKIYAVKNAMDTFDSPEHNREEWTEIAYKAMAQAGIIILENIEELEKGE